MGWQDAPKVEAAPSGDAWKSAPAVKVAPKAKPNPKDDSALRGFLAGAKKPIDNLALAASKIPYIGPAVDELGQALGMPSTAESYQGGQEARADNTRTNYQIAGSIVPTALATRGRGLFTGGAIGGAVNSDAESVGGVAQDAALGAGASVIGGKVLSGIGSFLAPKVNRFTKAISDAGVPMTLGQMASGGKGFGNAIIARGEQALTSAPFLGGLIGSARGGGVEAYNRALAAKALAPIGKKLPKDIPTGMDATDFVSQQLSNSYERVIPNLAATIDKPFVTGLNAAKAEAKTLPDATKKQMASILQSVFGNRFNGAQISAQSIKKAESSLGAKIQSYRSSADPDQREMANILSGVRDQFRQMVIRQNPEFGPQLQAINKGWAQLKLIEKAAGNNAEGLFTPKAMLSAARKAGATRRGAPDRELIIGAARNLSNDLPNSGTADRGLAAILLGGGAGAALAPKVAIPAATLASLYTKPGMKLINKAAFAKRPEAIRAIGTGAKRLSELAKVIGPVAVPPLLARRDE